MNIKVNIHKNNSNIKVALERVNKWNVPGSVKVDIENFLEDARKGKINLGKSISDRTRVKYTDLLKTPLTFFNKPIEKIVLEDVEDFEKSLSTGKLKKQNGEPYKDSGQKDIKSALQMFLKWKLGEQEMIKLAGWLDTRDKKRTPDYLKEIEIEKLYKSCKSAKERFLIAVLFDAGCRAEEFLNIRLEDIELPTK